MILLGGLLDDARENSTRRSRITKKRCVSSQTARCFMLGWRLRWPARPARSSHRRVAQDHSVGPRPFREHVSAWPMLCWPTEMLAKRLPSAARSSSRSPTRLEAIVILGAALAAEGKVEEAIPHFERALKLEPHNAPAHFRLGLALDDLGQSQAPLTHLNEAIRLQPDDVLMLWQTAWILATSPDPSIRDGARGVELASRAVQLSGGREPRAFDALAAALAETEKFSAAVEAAEQASALALARDDDALVDAIAERTRLYRQGLPYRQPAAPVPADNVPPAADK